jgi:hypothetical protein
MRFALILLALLALAPLAAAQVPQPSEVVATACAALGAAPDVRDHVPVCPKADPAPADPAAEHEHDHGAAPGTPQDAPALAADAVDTAQQAAQEPASAPSKILGFVATLVQFVKDLLHLPVVAGAHIADGFVSAGHAIADAATATKDAIATAGAAVHDATAHALDAVKSLFAPAPSAAHGAPGKLVPGPVRAPSAAKLLTEKIVKLT